MTIVFSFRKRDLFYPAWTVTDSTIEFKRNVIPFCDIIDAKMYCASNGVFEIKTSQKTYYISFNRLEWDKATEAYHYVLAQCPAAMEQRIAIEAEEEKQKELAAKCQYTPTPKQKDASVVGRAIAGGVVAGPVGAVVGALSAVDKNNRNKK